MLGALVGSTTTDPLLGLDVNDEIESAEGDDEISDSTTLGEEVGLEDGNPDKTSKAEVGESVGKFPLPLVGTEENGDREVGKAELAK